MRRRFFRYWWVGVLCLLIGVAMVFFSVWSKYAGFSEAYRVSSPNFEIRVMIKGTILFNYTFLFQSGVVGNQDWKDVFEYTSDADSSKEMIRIVNDSTGYIKGNRVFAVTRDAGTSWTFSELDKIFPMSEEASKCTWISAVNIEVNGAGTMELRGCSKAKPLITKDYGLTWQ